MVTDCGPQNRRHPSSLIPLVGQPWELGKVLHDVLIRADNAHKVLEACGSEALVSKLLLEIPEFVQN